jgi:transcriptional regulator with XRE-family HTH domain
VSSPDEQPPLTPEMRAQNRTASPELLCRLANNLKQIRNARGYTQEQLAELCRLHKDYISDIEQATVNITLANLIALARALDCAESELLRRR